MVFYMEKLDYLYIGSKGNHQNNFVIDLFQILNDINSNIMIIYNVICTLFYQLVLFLFTKHE